MMQLSDYVIRFVADRGVRHIFMLPGGGCMYLVDALGRSRDVQFICNLHEQGCAVAADAYAQFTNTLGVALVTTGPGGTNTITGVAAAWLDSIPCLFLSGQVKRADSAGPRGVRQMGFQEIDIAKVVRSITKYAVTVTEPDSIRFHLEKAVCLARSGRPGPVWLDIPLDVQSAAIDETCLKGFDPDEGQAPADSETLQRQAAEAIELLNRSERPVLLAGNGIRLAKGEREFHQLIDLLQVPVLTTWKAIDFLPESHALYAGRPGAVGQRGANFTQQNSDCLLMIGARMDFGQTGYNHSNLARAARKIMVDVDPAEIRKMATPIDVPIVADAKAFLQELLRQKDHLAAPNRSGWLARCKEWQARYPVILPEHRSGKGPVNLYALIDALSEEMSREDLLIPGSSGACSEATMQAFRVKEGMRIFNSEGLGPMGFGIPASIGGCVASGLRRTVCVDGDGGFHMNSQELEVVRRLNLPIKFFVLNNQGYGSIRATQRNYFSGRFVASDAESGLTLPDIRKIGRAYGIASTQIRSNQNLRRKVRAILRSDGPAVCEVMVSTEQMTAPRLSSMQRPDGSIVSKPLEDLWPFLDRREFLSNMLVPPLDESS
jgi:acetolactate synthase I/II/III large subunit